jgi:hypothetical protein
MFKLDNKEYDESKLNDKGKFSFTQLQSLGQKKNSVLSDLNNLEILISHYSDILKKELPKEEKEKKANNK